MVPHHALHPRKLKGVHCKLDVVNCDVCCGFMAATPSMHWSFCREVKERMKKTKAEKASQKAAEAKKAGAKATKNMPRGGGVQRGGKR